MGPITRIACALALLASAALIVSGTWAAHHWPYRQDRHLFEYMGQCILGGGRIYLDCWDNKPPLVPWINAAVLGVSDQSTVAVSVAAGSAAAVTAAATAAGAFLWFGPTEACFTALTAAALLSLRYYDGCTNGTELYGAMFESLAALALLAAWRRPHRPALPGLLAAGASFAAAFACKQNYVAGPASVFIVMLIAAARARPLRPAGVRTCLGLTGGFAAVSGAIAMVLHRQGALREAWFAVYGSNLFFAEAGLCWWNPLAPGVGGILLEQVRPMTPVLLTAAVGLAAGLAGQQSADDEPWRPATLPSPLLVVLAVWALLAAWTVLPGGCHLTRYWHAVFVPLLWLHAQALHAVGRGLTSGPPATRLVLAAAVAVSAVSLWKPLAVRQRSDLLQAEYYRTEDSERARLLEIADFVRSRTAGHEHIYVWGYEPALYRFAARRAPTRFAELSKVTFLGRRLAFMVDEVAAALEAFPPKLILVGADYRCFLQTGRWGEVDVGRVAGLLRDRYRGPIATIHGYEIYERCDAGHGPSALADPPPVPPTSSMGC